MRASLVLTVIGADRPGLVEALSDAVAAHGANWEASHMARLGGQFAGILLVTAPGEAADRLVGALRGLEARGLQVTVQRTTIADTDAGARTLALDLIGNDRPGIVRDIARVLAERGVNVEELETEVTSAPMSGEPLFHARARLSCPAALALPDLRGRLEALANELMVDIKIE